MSVVDNIADDHPLISHDFFEDDSGIDDLKEQRRAEMKAAEANPEEYIKQAKMAAAKKKAESLIARIKNRTACDVEETITTSDVSVEALPTPTYKSSTTNQTQPMVSQDSENIEEVLFDTEPQQPASGSKTIIIHNVKKLIIRL